MRSGNGIPCSWIVTTVNLAPEGAHAYNAVMTETGPCTPTILRHPRQEKAEVAYSLNAFSLAPRTGDVFPH